MKLNQLSKTILLPVAFIVSACSQTPTQLNDDDSTGATQNFYQWVNEEWLANTSIPEDKPRMDNFIAIQDKVYQQQKDLLLGLSVKPKRSVEEQKINAIYQSFTDLAQRNAAGLTPLKDELKLIEVAKSHRDIAKLFGQLQLWGVEVPLMYGVSTDFKDSDSNIVFAVQGGLLLERELYLADTERAQKQRTLYQEMLTSLFQLSGSSHAQDQAQSVLQLETSLANIQWSNVENRNFPKMYNKTDYPGLIDATSNLYTADQLQTLGMPTRYPFNLTQPSYITALNDFLSKATVEQWKTYLTARLLTDYANLLSTDFKKAITQFQINRGLYNQEPKLWRQSVNYINDHVGMLMGELYVASYFDEASKAKVENVTHQIVAQYRLKIAQSDRLTEQTKANAMKKLDNMNFQIGYPDTWQDYSSLILSESHLVDNHQAINRYEMQRNIDKLGKPVDKKEWDMPPQSINAYYSSSTNTFTLLAGILNAPFYNAEADLAENFGGIGFVIGHEIGHGYDDGGSRFDYAGNMHNWWQQQDLEAFNQLKERLIDQANQYEILPGLFLNGALEIGEIMGDLSGAEIALAAYTLYAKDNKLNIEKGQKEFFMQLAKTWRTLARDEFWHQLVESDPHPPGEFRANGIVKNINEFHHLFNTKPGDPMYLAPEERVHIW